ncbi:MAG TPA: TSUP family transporter [Candidatus Methylomirabilis sp.]|nr:TSUP family transporter [Candidatus Methylomirabilis sp.]
MPLSFLGFLAIGAATGAVSGMFGIGGGIFVIPAMVWIYGFDQKMATGTSLGMLLPPIGIAAFWQYYKADLVNVPATLLLIVGFVAGSYLSAGYTIGLPALLVKRAFGGLMIAMGVIYILTAR